MKTNNILYVVLVIIFLTGCLSEKQSKDSLAFIDIRNNYPEKEILLTDIADVTYLYLNSDDDDYLYNGIISDLTKHTVVIYSHVSEDVLFFSKDGTPKSHFNRKGQGPEEYVSAMRVIYDEEADDVFVVGRIGRNIMVDSSTGEYKRKIALPQAAQISTIVSFDDHSFLLYDAQKRLVTEDIDIPTNGYDFPFVRISKADGKVLNYIELPDNKKIVLKDETIGVFGRTSRIVTCTEGALLCNPETDSVFLYSKDTSLTLAIYKTPAVNATAPMTYLNNCVDVGRYQFMEVFTVRWEEGAFPFPAKYYMRDKKTGEIFRQKIVLPDYKGREFLIGPTKSALYYGDENATYFELDIIELKQAYRENKLSGELKELVATLNEYTDNNVFMLVNFK